MEIERKILGIHKKSFISAIKRLKPKPRKVFEGFIRVRYFDFPDQRIRKKRDILRIREFVPSTGKPYTEAVYKIYRGVKKGSKYFEEFEYTIRDPAGFTQATKFLEQLGFVQTLYYEKKRTLYLYKQWKFEIDEHPKIPPFLEIEADSPAAIDKAIKFLNLAGHEQSAETIGELMKRKYPRIRLNGLKFKMSSRN